jgi:hypothetical protein
MWMCMVEAEAENMHNPHARAGPRVHVA